MQPLQIDYSFGTQTKINNLVHESCIPFPIGRQFEFQLILNSPKEQAQTKLIKKGNVKFKSPQQTSTACDSHEWGNLPGSSVQRGTYSLWRSRSCGSLSYCLLTAEEKANVILGHTCKCVLCKTWKKLLCSTWHQCSLSWSLVSSS